jgi:ABC-type sugar transport system substrate-binding protein
MRQSFGIAMGLAGAALLAGAISASAQDKPLTIGVSHQSLGFPYAVALENGELKAAKEMAQRPSTSIPISIR